MYFRSGFAEHHSPTTNRQGDRSSRTLSINKPAIETNHRQRKIINGVGSLHIYTATPRKHQHGPLAPSTFLPPRSRPRHTHEQIVLARDPLWTPSRQPIVGGGGRQTRVPTSPSPGSSSDLWVRPSSDHQGHVSSDTDRNVYACTFVNSPLRYTASHFTYCLSEQGARVSAQTLLQVH